MLFRSPTAWLFRRPGRTFQLRCRPWLRPRWPRHEGIPIGEKSAAIGSGAMPDRITLYRRAILDEWIEEGEDFATLIHHIVIHEVGHHFGLDDDAIHALEDAAS